MQHYNNPRSSSPFFTSITLHFFRSIFWSLEKTGTLWKKINNHTFIRNKYPGMLDKNLDKIVARLRGGMVPYFFYEHGWGDFQVPVTFYAWLERWSNEMSIARKKKTDPLLLPRRIDDFIIFSKHSSKVRIRNTHILAHEFEFPSPAREILHLMPKESHIAHACVISPMLNNTIINNHRTAEEEVTTKYWTNKIVILLPGTGDHGFSRRAASMALPLAQQHNVTSIILESPFYGKRKPKEQMRSKLRHVSDLPTLGRATIEETLSLIQWISKIKPDASIAVAGLSMGGLHAAMCASLSPIPVGVCAWVAPPSAAPVFSKGLLSQFCAWTTLEKQLLVDIQQQQQQPPHQNVDILQLNKDTTTTTTTNSTRKIHDVKEVMDSYLSFTDIRNFPSPLAPHRAVFVLTRDDLYVPQELAMESWQTCVENKWPGARISVIPGGHVTCTLFGSNDFRQHLISVL
jgi:hypothetical protein